MRFQMKLKLSKSDLKVDRAHLPSSVLVFQDFKPEVQRVIEMVGKAVFRKSLCWCSVISPWTRLPELPVNDKHVIVKFNTGRGKCRHRCHEGVWEYIYKQEWHKAKNFRKIIAWMYE